MAEQDNIGAPGPTGRRQWLRRAALALGLAGTLLAAVPAAAAHASPGQTPVPAAAAASGPDGCGSWYPASAEKRTSNNLLGVYLQAQNCPYGRYIKVAVRNYSSSSVGTRTYSLATCYSTGTPGLPNYLLETFEGVYIPARSAWASHPVWAGGEAVTGTINRPRAYPGATPEVETRTNCA